jgi:hypothetical protein
LELRPTFEASFQLHTIGEQVTKQRRNSGKDSSPLGDNNHISEEQDTRRRTLNKEYKREKVRKYDGNAEERIQTCLHLHISHL